MNSICKAMKAASMQRSYRRGPPRLKLDFVFERFQVTFTDELNNYFPRTNQSRGPDEKKTEYSSKSSNKSLPKKRKCDDRLALGLHAAGPLKIEDVKTAYRSCALKWHPDHHQKASSKAFAEEQFKKCNAAYQSLCDELSASSS
ncbi:hypothetical protein CASFOL_019613 [Castilleja foliolosa]|uniref:J domain-containing protein n=1 Tax=Castilleja foliolosa TaxID=1961234 RepID=A0ABD3D7Y9_9LAMI